MNSGLDTEAIITELASARSVKVQSMQKAQTKLSWKIDAWKELNNKIYSFYTDVLTDMRFDSAYSKKTTKVSNPNAVSVITGGNAVNGVQTLKVKNMAKNAYLTGGVVEWAEGRTATKQTRLESLGLGGTTRFNVTDKDGTVIKEVRLDSSSTIDDVVSALKDAGLNASFDENSGRFFVSAKETGKDGDFKITAVQDTVEKDGKTSFVNNADSEKALKKLGLFTGKDPSMDSKYIGTMIEGQDAEIELNGATFTSSNNTFEINGLTITAQQETGDEQITLTTAQDTDGIYDMIKNFITKYNELINEMDKLYNADSAAKYEPLTSEEKDAMSDTEVEEWEKKIKDSLLRRDSTLSGIADALKTVMIEGATVNGRKLVLSKFGIETLGYFNAKENERNAYHIDGNPDDPITKNNEEKLKAMIAKDPDTVIGFFKQLATNLYEKLDEKMARDDYGYSSAYTVYNDKQMAKELKDYDDKIKREQNKLNDYIDRWYEKFSQMEVALSKLNSQQSSISGLFG